MNDRSSRSHTIFRITIESRLTDEEQDRLGSLEASEGEANEAQTEGEGGNKEEQTKEKKKDERVRISTLNLVDLAGSESVRLTGASGERQKEGGKINQVRTGGGGGTRSKNAFGRGGRWWVSRARQQES
jgi:centromeric protein E